MIANLTTTGTNGKIFVPHAIVLTEFSVPRPIFAAALIRADKLKRIDFPPDTNPLLFVSQVLKNLPNGIPCFGFTTGFIINYEAEKAVQFDKYGNPFSILNKAKTVGHAKIHIS